MSWLKASQRYPMADEAIAGRVSGGPPNPTDGCEHQFYVGDGHTIGCSQSANHDGDHSRTIAWSSDDAWDFVPDEVA